MSDAVVVPLKILVQFVHPAMQKSKANKKLLKSIENLDHVTVNDLYEKYPDLQIDIKAEQQLLLDHDLIIFQHPFYWYSCPALLKEWMDVVLEYGFAFGRDGGDQLKGKFLLSVITSGGTKTAYCDQGKNRFTINQLLAPFEQTARFCHLKYLPPLVIYGAPSLTDADLDIWGQNYRQLICQLVTRKISPDLLSSHDYLNELWEVNQTKKNEEEGPSA